jgi:hypothetical protein
MPNNKKNNIISKEATNLNFSKGASHRMLSLSNTVFIPFFYSYRQYCAGNEWWGFVVKFYYDECLNYGLWLYQ